MNHSHLSLSSMSPSVGLTTCISSLTRSMNSFFGLPLYLLLGSSILSIFLPMYLLPLHCKCPNPLNLVSLILFPKLLIVFVPLIRANQGQSLTQSHLKHEAIHHFCITPHHYHTALMHEHESNNSPTYCISLPLQTPQY